MPGLAIGVLRAPLAARRTASTTTTAGDPAAVRGARRLDGGGRRCRPIPRRCRACCWPRRLAEEAGRPVRLSTYAISGSTTRDLVPQVDAAVLRPRREVALIIIGANDVTTRMTRRRVGRGCWANRCAGCARSAAASSSAPAPTWASCGRFPSRCGWSAASTACGSPRRRPPRCARAGGVPVSLGEPAGAGVHGAATSTCSAPTASTPAPSATRPPPACCWPRCARWRGCGRAGSLRVLPLRSAAALAVRPITTPPRWLQKRHA